MFLWTLYKGLYLETLGWICTIYTHHGDRGLYIHDSAEDQFGEPQPVTLSDLLPNKISRCEPVTVEICDMPPFLILCWEIYAVCFQCVLWARPVLIRKEEFSSTMRLSMSGTFNTVINLSLRTHVHTVRVDVCLFGSIPIAKPPCEYCRPSPGFGYHFVLYWRWTDVLCLTVSEGSNCSVILASCNEASDSIMLAIMEILEETFQNVLMSFAVTQSGWDPFQSGGMKWTSGSVCQPDQTGHFADRIKNHLEFTDWETCGWFSVKQKTLSWLEMVSIIKLVGQWTVWPPAWSVAHSCSSFCTQIAFHVPQ